MNNASMRPSGITDGIASDQTQLDGELDARGMTASMRPSGITDGIAGSAGAARRPLRCFNEAVGYYRRNRCRSRCSPPSTCWRFNEAVGYYRRNLMAWTPSHREAGASMRPSGITDGISTSEVGVIPDTCAGVASMRPSGITDGIRRAVRREWLPERARASMRPSGITDGIYRRPDHSGRIGRIIASMRPSGITDGIGPRPSARCTVGYRLLCERSSGDPCTWEASATFDG